MFVWCSMEQLWHIIIYQLFFNLNAIWSSLIDLHCKCITLDVIVFIKT